MSTQLWVMIAINAATILFWAGKYSQLVRNLEQRLEEVGGRLDMMENTLTGHGSQLAAVNRSIELFETHRSRR